MLPATQSDNEFPIEILVVDDTPANLESMKALLADTGASVVTASSGTDALRLLLKQDFALILLDVQMPDLDGYATAELIRSRERFRQTPIIFLTAYGRTEAQVVKGYSLGAVDYLFKPIVPEILKSKVAFFIDLHRKREQTRIQAELLRAAEKRELERALRDAQQQYARKLLEEERDRERRLAEAMNARAEELAQLVTEKADAERALIKTNERLELLADVANELLHTQDPTAHVQRIYGSFGAHLGLEIYLHYVVDEGRKRLLLESHMGLSDEVAAKLEHLVIGESWIGTVARHQARAVYDSALPDPAGDPLAKLLGARAMACIPLVSADQLLGVVVVASKTPRTFTQDELAIAQVGCDQLAVAIERHALINRLRESDRRKDEFLAMLGHELRNPLAPIRNALEVVRARFGNDVSLQRTLIAADRQVRHMTRLLDDLLDVSRITRGKVELRREHVDLSGLVEQAVHATEAIMRDRRHTLKVELPDAPVVLDADPARITQVLANLLQNAAKYTEPGGRIALRATLEAEGLRLGVQDSGIGIRPEMLGRVFEMFVQEEPTSDRALGGLGLGLTLVKSLVEMHGGRVEAHSEGLGKGSRFEVILPVAALPKTSQLVAPLQQAARAAETEPLRVLVVEDNEDVRCTMQDLLELRGHEVHLAHDGPSGVAAALTLRPHVALVDIGLPGMDGCEVARRIRAEGGRDFMLVALTGYGGEEAKARTLGAGFDEHLVKPIAAEDLWSLLDRSKRTRNAGEDKTCRPATQTTSSMPAPSSRPSPP